MKRTMFFFALLLTSATLMFAQRGHNNYRGGQRGGNGYHSNGSVGYNAGGSSGAYHYDRGPQRNRRAPARINAGRGFANGYVRHTNFGPRQRVIWEYSDCGRYRWRCTQRGIYQPGYWAFRRGCRTWVDPYWGWTTPRRVRSCI